MELGTPSSDDCGYPIKTKFVNQLPIVIVTTQHDPISEQLYKKDITKDEIRKLVKEGALLNYSGSLGPIPIHYAYNATEQGVENMKTIIELGAQTGYFDSGSLYHTPLNIAAQTYKKNKSAAMFLLLAQRETPTVTKYTYFDSQGQDHTTRMEVNNREDLITAAFNEQSVEVIQLSLEQKLFTANRGLKEFAKRMKPNQKILDLLLQYGANNGDDLLAKIMHSAFPSLKDDAFASTQYIRSLKQMCESKAFNLDVYLNMLAIKKDVDAIVQALEANQPK
jgi:hypothetical protein